MNKTKGFSLTEIVVTIVIIVVLSTISGPIYNHYSVKAKQAEGYLLLGTIKDAQMKWYDASGHFWNKYQDAYGGSGGIGKDAAAPDVCYDEVFGIDARANKYYSWFTPNNLSSYGASGNKTFIAIVSGSNVKDISMICPEDKPTTIL